MNKNLQLIAFGIIFSLLMPVLNAQDCRLFFPDRVGSVREMKFYDQKNKLSSISKQEIIDKKVSGNNVTVNVKSTNYTTDNQEINTVELEFSCENGTFKFDMASLLDPKTMEAYKDMAVEITSDNILFPSNLKVGDSLPDGSLKMVVKSGEITIITINLSIFDRKVVAKEDVTTEAGTFPCYKLTYNTTSKFGFITVNSSTVEWLAEGVGIVRNEQYNKKDKLSGYSVLTNFVN